ncbi:MAG: ATP-binding cassette domain-containing protein [Candidatus Kariarchaeaceae archaeon]|jgi:ABC-2 type transport system ATP-binding protein
MVLEVEAGHKSSDSPFLVCSNLSKKFDNLYGVRDINLETNTPALGLLGPNGSGKTTLIRLMLGLIAPTDGLIELNVDKEDIRVVTERPVLPTDMTIDEWLETVEAWHGNPSMNLDIQSNFGLEGEWKIKHLSAGQQRKAALMSIFYGDPKLIVLDEPTNYLDIVSREYILRLIVDHLKNTQAKLILATHRIEEIQLFAEETILMKEGQILKKIDTSNPKIVFYSMQTSDLQRLKLTLDIAGIYSEIANSLRGDILKVRPANNLWKVLDAYQEEGHKITSMQEMDEISETIEEFLT